ncbi:thyroid hormone receptor interactor 11-like protein [Shewanella sp. PS-2]|uniref:Thyroid hormone receptor interactor 11-like protein n=2 Tax=Shewanella cutis TaxID=2766780 RepID=A0ABS9R0A0_9GAMM|nr:thyroid hormone receptor interactor 11-like protein [Shewanella sp. PS-2]
MKFNKTPRDQDNASVRSGRKPTPNPDKTLTMRRIEAIRDLKEMGFTQEEIQQLAQE